MKTYLSIWYEKQDENARPEFKFTHSDILPTKKEGGWLFIQEKGKFVKEVK